MALNSISLEGNLVRDPELKHSKAGMPIAKFSIAVNEGRKQPDGSWENIGHFFDVVAFKDVAEQVAKLSKGQRLVLVGKIQQEKWETQDGQSRSKVSIIANNIGVVNREQQQYQPKPKPDLEDVPDKGIDFDSDIPF